MHHRALMLLVAYVALRAPAMDAQTPAPAAPPKQKTAASLPSGRDVVAKYVRAIGGREAIVRHSSRRATGTFTMGLQGVNGTVEVVAAKPDKLVVSIAVPGLGEIKSGYDGTTAWMINPMMGPMVLEGRQREEARQDADFFAMLHEDPGETLETLEAVDFDGRRCYRVRVKRKDGPEDIEYYDVASGLLVGSEAERDSPMGVVKALVLVGEYKKFDDLLIATRTTQRLAGVEQVIMIATVEHDTVPPSAFEPPVQIKGIIAK
jgi:hypothetical protein